jgi:hypothetical protein
MLRVVVGVVVLLLAPACTHPSPPEPEQAATSRVEPPKLVPIHPTDHLELSGISSSPPTDIGDGNMAHHFGTIFMKNTLSKATVPVNLHTRGITAKPDSEAQLYLANQQGLLIPYALIGSIKVPADGATEIIEIAEVVHVLEGNAREELRSMAHFGIVMVVTKGSVKVEKIILSIPAREPPLGGHEP